MTDEHSDHSPLYTFDSVGRKYEAPCPWCKDAQVKRLRELLELAFVALKGGFDPPSTWLARTRKELYP